MAENLIEKVTIERSNPKTKIKIFTLHVDDLNKDEEKRVNDFMADKEVLSIKIVPAMTEGGPDGDSYLPKLIVVYQE